MREETWIIFFLLKRRLYRYWAALSSVGIAQAKSLEEAGTLLEAAGDPNESSFMKDNISRLGANAGITYNAAAPTMASTAQWHSVTGKGKSSWTNWTCFSNVRSQRKAIRLTSAGVLTWCSVPMPSLPKLTVFQPSTWTQDRRGIVALGILIS